MRLFALMLCALAVSTLDGSGQAHAQPAPAAAVAAKGQQLGHISVQSIGSGDPVVLIPGLSSPRDVWAGIAPELAKTHRVLLVQVNGFAGDDARDNGKDRVLDGVTDDIAAYLADNHLGSAKVIGHSMGGLIALKLALAHPASVSRLMVVDALPFFGTILQDKPTVEMVRPMAEMMRSRMVGAAAALKAKAMTPVTTDPGGDMSLNAEGRIKIANWAIRSDPAVVGQAVYEDMTTDLRQDIARIAAPMTVLYHTGGDPAGENAKIYSRDYAAQPKAKLIAVPNAAHFIMLDQPAAFAAAVDRFLN